MKLKKESDIIVEFNRDDSKLHNATLGTIITNMIAWAILIIDVIAIIFVKEKTIPIVIAIAIIVYGTFCDLYYNYQEMCSIKILKGLEKDSKNKIVYQYMLNDSITSSSNCVSTVKISSIKKVAKRGKKIEIHGDISIKRPMQKSKNISKIKINGDNYNESINSIIDTIKNKCM